MYAPEESNENWASIDVSKLIKPISAQTEVYYDVYIKTYVKTFVKNMKVDSPDSGSNFELAYDAVLFLKQEQFIKQFLASESGLKYLDELPKWIEDNFSKEKEIVSEDIDVEEELFEESQIDRFIREDKEKPDFLYSAVDTDFLSDSLVKAIKDKDSYKQNAIKQMLSEIQSEGNSNIKFMYGDDGAVLGFTYKGEIFLNREAAHTTLVEEAAHLWMDKIKVNNPKLYNEGLKKVQGSIYMQDVTVNPFYIREALKQGKEGSTKYNQYLEEEALSKAIKDKGKQLSNDERVSFLEWLSRLFKKLKEIIGLSKLTIEEVKKLTLSEFSERALRDIFKETKEVSEDMKKLTDLVIQSTASLNKESNTKDIEYLLKDIYPEVKGLSTPEEFAAFGKEIDNTLEKFLVKTYPSWIDKPNFNIGSLLKNLVSENITNKEFGDSILKMLIDVSFTSHRYAIGKKASDKQVKMQTLVNKLRDLALTVKYKDVVFKNYAKIIFLINEDSWIKDNKPYISSFKLKSVSIDYEWRHSWSRDGRLFRKQFSNYLPEEDNLVLELELPEGLIIKFLDFNTDTLQVHAGDLGFGEEGWRQHQISLDPESPEEFALKMVNDVVAMDEQVGDVNEITDLYINKLVDDFPTYSINPLYIFKIKDKYFARLDGDKTALARIRKADYLALKRDDKYEYEDDIFNELIPQDIIPFKNKVYGNLFLEDSTNPYQGAILLDDDLINTVNLGYFDRILESLNLSEEEKIHIFQIFNDNRSLGLMLLRGKAEGFISDTAVSSKITDLIEQATDEQKIIYTGAFVDTSLEEQYSSKLPNKFGHHMTVSFRPKKLDVSIGEKVQLKVTGRLTTDKVDVLIIENDKSTNEFPHITLATAEGVKPFASNAEIKNNQDKIVPLDETIEATYGYFDGTNNIVEIFGSEGKDKQQIAQDTIAALELLPLFENVAAPFNRTSMHIAWEKNPENAAKLEEIWKKYSPSLTPFYIPESPLYILLSPPFLKPFPLKKVAEIYKMKVSLKYTSIGSNKKYQEYLFKTEDGKYYNFIENVPWPGSAQSEFEELTKKSYLKKISEDTADEYILIDEVPKKLEDHIPIDFNKFFEPLAEFFEKGEINNVIELIESADINNINLAVEIIKGRVSEESIVKQELSLGDLSPKNTLSDIAKLLNTSDIKFDLNIAPGQIQYSLTPELSKVYKYALASAKTTAQKIVIMNLFHGAELSEEEIISLSATDIDFTKEGGLKDIVVLHEKLHRYENLTTKETYKSTTESILGKSKQLIEYQLNRDLGNDFDTLIEGLAGDVKFEDLLSKMKIMDSEKSKEAYKSLQSLLYGDDINPGLTNKGEYVAIPQVVVFDKGTKRGGKIDILLVSPQGKLKIVDLKTSKWSINEKDEKGNYVYETKKWGLKEDSEILKSNVLKEKSLTKKGGQAIQVNLYARYLENMGYEISNEEDALTTLHIKVGIEGKGLQQRYTGEFIYQGIKTHAPSAYSRFINVLAPVNVNSRQKRIIEDNIKAQGDSLIDGKTIADDAQMNDPISKKSNLITRSLREYQTGLINKREALQKIKSKVWSDKTGKEEIEEIDQTALLISVHLNEADSSFSFILHLLVFKSTIFNLP